MDSISASSNAFDPINECENSRIGNSLVYSSSPANSRARTLSVVPHVKRKLVVANAPWGKVRVGLQQGLSLEQVAGTQARMNEPVRLCHETIYQAIYMKPKGELRTDTIALLHFGHSKRRPRPRGWLRPAWTDFQINVLPTLQNVWCRGIGRVTTSR